MGVDGDWILKLIQRLRSITNTIFRMFEVSDTKAKLGTSDPKLLVCVEARTVVGASSGSVWVFSGVSPLRLTRGYSLRITEILDKPDVCRLAIWTSKVPQVMACIPKYGMYGLSFWVHWESRGG